MTVPHYNTWLKCVNIDTKNNTALVRSNKTGKCFPVTLNKDIKYLVSKGDHLHVVKSHVSKEWIAIDYNAMTAVGDEDE
jgi:hypothetical protein